MPTGDALASARRRLAQRWVAVGSERLGQEDAAFARRAQNEARQLILVAGVGGLQPARQSGE